MVAAVRWGWAVYAALKAAEGRILYQGKIRIAPSIDTACKWAAFQAGA